MPSITYGIIYGGLTLKNKLRKYCLRNKVASFSTLGFIGGFFFYILLCLMAHLLIRFYLIDDTAHFCSLFMYCIIAFPQDPTGGGNDPSPAAAWGRAPASTAGKGCHSTGTHPQVNLHPGAEQLCSPTSFPKPALLHCSNYPQLLGSCSAHVAVLQLHKPRTAETWDTAWNCRRWMLHDARQTNFCSGAISPLLCWEWHCVFCM